MVDTQNTATTGNDGTCTIEGVKGEVTITVSKEGYITQEETLTVSQNESLTVILEDVDDDNLEDTTRNVKFNVQDSEETSVSGASIRLSANSEVAYESGNGGTGPRGGATIKNVTYGNYDVTVTKNETSATFTLTVGATLSVTGDSATVNTTSSGETVKVTLTE